MFLDEVMQSWVVAGRVLLCRFFRIPRGGRLVIVEAGNDSVVAQDHARGFFGEGVYRWILVSIENLL